MSSYNARRAPNVSQYLAGLNLPAQDITQTDFSLDSNFDDLATLDFFDIDGAVQFGQPQFQPETQDNAKPGMCITNRHRYPMTLHVKEERLC